MKTTNRLISLLLALTTGVTALCFGVTTAYADTSFDEGDFRFTYTSSDTLLVSKYYGDETAVELPETGGGKAVTGVYTRCFENSGVTSVTMPDDYTVIGAFAFNGCQSLTSVNLPAKLTTIGTMAFYNCPLLQNVDFSESEELTAVSFAAFSNCTSLESVSLPDSVTTLGENAFSNCTALNELWLPAGLTTIPEYAFYGSALESVLIPANVTEIGTNAFAPQSDEGTLCVYCYYGSDAAAYCQERMGENVKLLRRGDADFDGMVNITDVTVLQRHLAELELLDPYQRIAADTNGDGVVAVDDATLIQQYLAEYDVEFEPLS